MTDLILKETIVGYTNRVLYEAYYIYSLGDVNNSVQPASFDTGTGFDSDDENLL